MRNWRMATFGDILTESKVVSENSNPDRRITVRLNVKGVEKRGYESSIEGATKYFTRKAGQFIYGKQNLFKGAFGIVPPELDGLDSSSDIPAFDVSKDCLPEWIIYFLRQGDFYKSLEGIAKGTGSRRIHPENLFKVEIPVPSISEQIKLIKKFKTTEEKYSDILSELTAQQTLITQLRQSILQEAVQGKLVRQNKNDEPASELLKRIKAEKEKLVKQGKLKKEKLLLPPITEKDIPYQLPDGWVWCRLGDMCSKIGSGSTPRGGKDVYTKDGIIFLRSQNVHNEGLDLSNVAYIDDATHKKMSGTKVVANDILLNITGGSIGRCALIPNDFIEANVSQHVTIIRLIALLNHRFIHNFILSPYFQDKIMEVQTGGNREGLAKKNMQLMLVPLPPLPEQKRIVEKVNQLMQHCNELEQEVQQSITYAQQLMQAVLREVFEGKKEMKYKVKEQVSLAAEE